MFSFIPQSFCHQNYTTTARSIHIKSRQGEGRIRKCYPFGKLLSRRPASGLDGIISSRAVRMGIRTEKDGEKGNEREERGESLRFPVRFKNNESEVLDLTNGGRARGGVLGFHLGAGDGFRFRQQQPTAGRIELII